MTTIVTRSGKGSPLTHVEVDTNFTNLNTNKLEAGAIALGSAATPSISFTGDTNTGIYSPGADQLAVATNGTSRLSIDASGNVAVDTNTLYVDAVNNRVAIGTTSPSYPLSVKTTTNGGQSIFDLNNEDAGNYGGLRVHLGNTDRECRLEATYNSSFFTFYTAASSGSGTEKARLDSDGRLLVGTSTGGSVARLQVQGSTIFNDAFADLCYNGSAASGIAANTNLGVLRFTDQASNSNIFAQIACATDAAASSGDYPGRLVFSTNPGSPATSPTERMRITKVGQVLIGADNPTGDSNLFVRTNGGVVGYFDRGTNDGTIISLRQADIEEGSISVSGTTVSYNGAHLSRWSQLLSGAERTEILRGSVLSNIDEMCEWGEEDNEQLNRMKVSDVEGDKNVSGVFQAWDDDDDTYINDFYCAMTGDFIIRIAEGVTVERGDLLMSAGDGTAKPQDDDIIRSKTIAKVTSINVSCTYEDGSYCVPCVLMSC